MPSIGAQAAASGGVLAAAPTASATAEARETTALS
jgi:hypothetical protein